MSQKSRREFLKELGLGTAALPFVFNLPSLAGAAEKTTRPKQRLVIMFSPNGVVPPTFWPEKEGEAFELKESLAPLEPFRDRTLILRGVCDKIRGDGDNHMRGIGCLLTGVELFPGNIQGGSHTPAGWSRGISIDQELKKRLQKDPATRTRFGSLEFGVMVPDRADTWTRMVYAGPNQPIAPIDNPYQMFDRLYGQLKVRADLESVLDVVKGDLARIGSALPAEDRQILEAHAEGVRTLEREIAEAQETSSHPVPELEPGVHEKNDQMPKISRMQIDLMVHAFQADFARIATLQYTNSVGQAKMRWIDVPEGHHELSHKPDSDETSQKKLTRINRWFCEQLAYLAERLAETPEPGGDGSMLDHTTILWTNELGKGNSHTLDNIPFVAVGGGLGWRMGRALKFPKVPHNRLLLAIAEAMGHPMKTFGNPDYCGDGPLTGLV